MRITPEISAKIKQQIKTEDELYQSKINKIEQDLSHLEESLEDLRETDLERIKLRLTLISNKINWTLE